MWVHGPAPCRPGLPHRGGASESSKPTSPAPAPSVEPDNGELNKSAPAVLADARQALRDAQSVHVTGVLADPTGGDETRRIDLRIGRRAAIGTIYYSEKPVRVVRSADVVYLRADEALPDSELPVGKWVQVRLDGTHDQLDHETDLATLDRELLDMQPTPGTSVFASAVDGQDAVEINVQGRQRLDVAARGEPLPLQIPNGEGQLRFTDYNAPLHVEPPTDFSPSTPGGGSPPTTA